MSEPLLEEPSTVKSRSYRGVGPAERQAVRRQKFLEAAARLIGREGFGQATVRRICAEARLTERYFYESFSNVENILCEAFLHESERLRREMVAQLSAARPDPELRMRLVLEGYFKFFRADREVARLLLHEIFGGGVQGEAAYREEMRRGTEATLRYVCIGLPEEPINGLSPRLLMSGCLGAVYQLAKEWMLDDCREQEADLVRNGLALFRGIVTQWQDESAPL